MILFFKKNQLFYIFLIANIIFSGIFILTGNYINLPKNQFSDYLQTFIHWSIISAAYGIIIYLLALYKKIFTFIFPLLQTISALLIYFVVQFDITINSFLISSFFNTNIDEVTGLISLKLILYLLFILVFSFISTFFRSKIEVQNIKLHFTILFIFTFFIFTINNIRYKTVSQRVPFSIYLAIKEYKLEINQLNEIKIDAAKNTNCNQDTLTVVLIIGEALRADHLSLNGYKRETCPSLKKQNILSFSNVYTQWTHTNSSIPHILTRADSTNYKPALTEKSVINLFNKCNYKTYWLGNQEPANTYISFVKECDTVILNKPMQTVYNFSKKIDGDLLPHFQNFTKQKYPKKFIIVHLIGSHWFYPSHYPIDFEIFKPTIKGKSFTNKDKQKMINAYDNSILYTDYIVNEFIKNLKNENSILLFLSDHGELLGENGKWLHAQDTEFEKNPAFFIWFSQKFKEKNLVKLNHAEKYKKTHFRNDFLFHSLLYIASIETSILDSTLVIFDPKFKKFNKN